MQISRRLLALLLVALTAVILAVIYSMPPRAIAILVGGFAGATFISTRCIAGARKAAARRSVEFFLPIVMEQIVMAVESGLDIIPALAAVLELNGNQDGKETSNPVIVMLGKVHRLTEAGLPFEKALREVAESSDCHAVRHAFVHLGLAQKEGGGVSAPLRELSDATQLYYQESMEEDIAKMPVRATMPLVLVFAGLILLFITSPLVQIMNMASTADFKDGVASERP